MVYASTHGSRVCFRESFRRQRTYLWPGKRTADWRKTLLMRAKSLKGAAGIGGLTRLAPRGATVTTVKPPGVFPGAYAAAGVPRESELAAPPRSASSLPR